MKRIKINEKDAYKGFKVGDYVRWREIDPYTDSGCPTVEKQGLIVGFRNINEFVRPFIYVMVLENKSGRAMPVLVHKLEKLETN